MEKWINMIDLDNLDAIKKLDKSDVYGSVDELPKQCLHAWESTKNFAVSDSYKDVNKIVMTGMGGSGLGARVIESVYGPYLKYPLIRVNDYDLPSWVDETTLVFCSSFSGTTEETVENLKQAQSKKAKWMVISTGGTLIELAKKYKAPYYQIIPTYNPSKQPRLAMGYSIVGQLVMASIVGLINFDKNDLNKITEALNKVRKVNNINVPTQKNSAKKTALAFHNNNVIFIAARHLIAAGHTIKNQMNENAKNFSAIFDIPELNHHLMEGLTFPNNNKDYLLYYFLDSFLYPKRIQQRMKITEEIVQQNNVKFLNWNASEKDFISQAFEFIQFGGFINFYLAILNGIDPAPIPWVDYFKTKLGQPLGQWKV